MNIAERRKILTSNKKKQIFEKRTGKINKMYHSKDSSTFASVRVQFNASKKLHWSAVPIFVADVIIMFIQTCEECF